MEEKIGTVRKKFAAAGMEELQGLIQLYERDERAGVKQEIKKAVKKLDTYEKEKERTKHRIERFSGLLFTLCPYGINGTETVTNINTKIMHCFLCSYHIKGILRI